MKEKIIIRSTDLLNNKYSHFEELSKQYRLYMFQMENFLYNVTSTNNKLYITINSIPVVVTIPNGFYGGTDLADNLQTQLIATYPNFTATYSSITGKIIFTNDTNISFTHETNTSNSSHKLFGLNAVDTTPATSYTSPNICKLITKPFIKLVIKEDTNKEFKDKDNVEASFLIHSNTSFGDNLIFTPDHYKPNIVCFNGNKILTLLFLDHDNNTMELNGAEWRIILEKL